MQVNYYRHSNDQGYEESRQSCHFTPVDLLAQVKARHSQLKRHPRDAALLDQIRRLHLLDPLPEGTSIDASPSTPSSPSIPSIPSSPSSTSSTSSPSSPSSESSKLAHDVNNSLTLPTHPLQAAASPVNNAQE